MIFSKSYQGTKKPYKKAAFLYGRGYNTELILYENAFDIRKSYSPKVSGHKNAPDHTGAFIFIAVVYPFQREL